VYLGDEIGPEEAEALLREMAKRIWGYGMETAAIMFLETSKPLAYIGAQMGQALLLPLLNFAGEVPLERGDKYLRVVQSRDNLENLIKMLEYLAIHEKLPEPEFSENRKEDQEAETSPEPETEDKGEEEKKGWKRFLPF
jgi:hypothetical protein